MSEPARTVRAMAPQASSRRAFLRGRALMRPEPSERLTISAACLARRNIVCGTCRDECPEGAIRMRPAIGRVPEPAVDQDRCTSCGACVAVCPSAAITLADLPDRGAADDG
jgi:ferredoxin